MGSMDEQQYRKSLLEERRQRENYISEELLAQVKDDPTVHAHLVAFTYGNTTYLQALENLAVALSKEKQMYQKETHRLKALTYEPPRSFRI